MPKLLRAEPVPFRTVSAASGEGLAALGRW